MNFADLREAPAMSPDDLASAGPAGSREPSLRRPQQSRSAAGAGMLPAAKSRPRQAGRHRAAWGEPQWRGILRRMGAGSRAPRLADRRDHISKGVLAGRGHLQQRPRARGWREFATPRGLVAGDPRPRVLFAARSGHYPARQDVFMGPFRRRPIRPSAISD